MKRNILNAILIGLLSIFAVACGDPGADPLEGEPGLGEELGEEEGGQVDGPNVDDENVDEENVDDEENVEDEEEPAPFCGDGFVDEDEECDDGNEADGDGCSSLCEIEVFEGEGEGEIIIDLVVDDLDSNEAPLEDGCTGTIAVAVNNEALVGEGRCFISTGNFLDYSVSADVDEAGAVEGDIVITLNNRPNALALSGTLDDGVLSLEFDGVTILVGSIRGVWNGTIQADFD